MVIIIGAFTLVAKTEKLYHIEIYTRTQSTPASVSVRLSYTMRILDVSLYQYTSARGATGIKREQMREKESGNKAATRKHSNDPRPIPEKSDISGGLGKAVQCVALTFSFLICA